jgi:peptidoglycan/xylan/chitin deacetylase (PgdA/CDA1 family)
MRALFSKELVFGAAEALQLNALARSRFTDSIAGLCYHGVVQGDRSSSRILFGNTVSVPEFEGQLDYLLKWFTPISAADLADALDGKKKLPKNPVIVTFDDGYRNNYTLAAPVLRKKGVPAIFHLSTNYIGGETILWPDEVLLRIVDWPEPTLETPFGSVQLPATTGCASRIPFASGISQKCKRISAESRDEFITALRQKTPPVPSHYDAEAHEFLNWDEARKMVELGFELGSHTVSHPILANLNATTLAEELVQSRAAIERMTGTKCTVIAYPNGSTADYSELVTSETEKAGYRIAFAVEDRRAGAKPPRFAIPRLGVPGHMPLAPFYSKVSGFYALLGRGR